jgi:hypothetical protein
VFGLFRRPTSLLLTEAVKRAIAQDGMTASVSNPSQLRMVETRGRYSNRKVTYFRVFDPTSAAQQSMDIRRYQDIDLFPGLALRSGHVERGGTVVLTRPVTVRAAETPSRAHADRMLHADDAHIMRGETGATANPTAIPTPMSGQAS